jgi:3-deoxy-D-manno-octulosonic-acid transferase
MSSVARWFYSLLLGLLSPVYGLRLWWRGKAEPMYRMAWSERWGFYGSASDAEPRGRLWIHAVSLGETLAAGALIDAMRQARPGLPILLTHGTATGRAAGARLLRQGDRQLWLPIDTPGAVGRFLAHAAPPLGVLMETEIWPNLLHRAAARGVPMVLVNARLSERSLRAGQRAGLLLRPAFRSLKLALAQSEADAARLRTAGVAQVEVCGNLKFDLAPDPAKVAQGRAWRQAVGREVVLAAVTREGEEAPLFAAWSRLAMPRPLLVVVPRHPQRFDEVAVLARDAGFDLARRSSWPAGLADMPPDDASSADVWLGDSMGEMALYYGMAQVALLGGSFAPLGGQNLIEAAACGCPVVMGPHTFNFAAAAAGSLAAGAAERVVDIEAGVSAALALLRSADIEERSRRGLAFAASQRGAAARMADAILALVA